MARIKNLPTATPGKDDVIVIDGEGGTRKVPLGDLAALVGKTGIAGFHNSVYRGANLKERFGINDDKALADEVSRRIADGSFDDLFVGDYFTITITSNYGTENVDVVLAGFDVYLGSFDEWIEYHHAVCVTRGKLHTNHKMNATHTTDGAYEGSEMCRVVLPAYATAFNSALNGHVKTVCDSVTCSMDSTKINSSESSLTGASEDWESYDLQLSLLTERELFGSPVYSSSAYDVGYETSQLPLFRLNPASKAVGDWYWLKDVASAQYFCNCGGDGSASYSSAGIAYGVRPRFLIG